jgi:hypothetical protein
MLLPNLASAVAIDVGWCRGFNSLNYWDPMPCGV